MPGAQSGSDPPAKPVGLARDVPPTDSIVTVSLRFKVTRRFRDVSSSINEHKPRLGFDDFRAPGDAVAGVAGVDDQLGMLDDRAVVHLVVVGEDQHRVRFAQDLWG